MEETDEDLVARCQDGSVDAFEELVRRYQPRILGFLDRQVGHREDAEDVTQRTFVQAYRSIPRFKQGYRFSPWLFTIARRQAIDFLRQVGSRRRLEETVEANHAEAEVEDPSLLLRQREGVDTLWRWVHSTLDERSAGILWLRVQEEMDLTEIAKVMKLTRTHVKVLLHRARKALARSLPDAPPVRAGARTVSRPLPSPEPQLTRET